MVMAEAESTTPADTGGTPAGGQPAHARRVHWHVALTHFPISLFGTAFLFQVLHLLMFEKPFELATTVCILAGAASLVPAIISGWITWKSHYHGATVRLFQRKIATAFGMLGVSVPLAIWRVVLYRLGNEADGIDHYVFFVLTTGLIAGAIAEGYLGGRLSHK
jgi:uncharacterized membrane protein